MRRIIRLMVVLLCLVTLTGCYGVTGFDDRGYVLSLGVDRGEEKKFLFTFQLPKLSGDAAQGWSGVSTISIEAQNILDAVEQFDTAISWSLQFLHTNYIVISDEVAKSADMLEVLSVSPRLLQLRQTDNLFIAKGSAYDFLKGLADSDEINFTKLQKQMASVPYITGLYPDTVLIDYYESCDSKLYDVIIPLGVYSEKVSEQLKEESGEGSGQSGQEQSQQSQAQSREAFVPCSAEEALRSGGLPTQVSGCAFFKDGKMIGELNGEETRFVMLGKGNYTTGRFSIPQEETWLTTSLTQLKKPSVVLTLEDTPRANITVKLEAEVYTDAWSNAHGIAYERPIDIQAAKKLIEEYVKAGLETVAAKCYSQGADVLGLGMYAVRQFKTIAEWEKFDWSKYIAQAQITFDVQVQTKPANLTAATNRR